MHRRGGRDPGSGFSDPAGVPGVPGAPDSAFGGMPSIPLSPNSLARVGLGAYGDKFLGAGSAFVSSGYAKYFSSADATYFDVTESYAWNKLRLILCPFLHRGSWARVPEHGPGHERVAAPADADHHPR